MRPNRRTPLKDPEKYVLGRSPALPGEGSWCVTYGRFMIDEDYECIQGFLTKMEANALLKKLREKAIRAQSQATPQPLPVSPRMRRLLNRMEKLRSDLVKPEAPTWPDRRYYVQSDGQFKLLSEADKSSIPYSISNQETQAKWPRTSDPKWKVRSIDAAVEDSQND